MNRRSRRIDFMQDFVTNGQNLIINDIDLPLINYAFICRQKFSDLLQLKNKYKNLKL
jgi:hypothetical protein